MNNFGYKIIEIYELNNILCINEDLCNILKIDKLNKIKELYKTQYINNFRSNYTLPWNKDINYCLKIKNFNELKKEIINYFSNYNNGSTFQTKNKN